MLSKKAKYSDSIIIDSAPLGFLLWYSDNDSRFPSTLCCCSCFHEGTVGDDVADREEGDTRGEDAGCFIDSKGR